MDFDLLIRDGIVVDGSRGARRYRADVAIAGDRIEAIGRLDGARAQVEIDAAGKVVCPGFIDVHVHSEIELLGGPHRYGGLLQGVTTHLTAPDGFGWAPLPRPQATELWDSTLFAYGASAALLDTSSPEGYLGVFAGRTPANIVPQVPHCAVRMAVMGWDARPASDEELGHMRALVRAWMDAGAVGLCVGLDYQPSVFSDTRELVALCRVVGEYGGLYASHQRYNLLGRENAWWETMQIGAESGIPVHVSHERVNDLTRPLLAAAPERCDLTFESYMYPAGCTHLAMMLTVADQAGGPQGLLRRLADPVQRERIKAHLRQVPAFRAEGPHEPRAVIASTQTGRYVGMTMPEAARSAGREVGEFAADLLLHENPYVLMVYHHGVTPEAQAEIIRETARHPAMLVASDGIYHGPLNHPRGYGCFARVLRLCVREMQALSLEEAIYKMTGFPAERFRIARRGRLAPGWGADVVIFDPDRVADRSTWEKPYLEPVGIERVIVNGRTVVLDGRPTGELPGRLIRRRGA